MCIVGDDAEPRVGSVFFHNSPQRHLGGGGHGVGFVENDKFERCERSAGVRFLNGREDLLCAAEGLDLFAAVYGKLSY
jgi:hypothetical protein